MARRQDKMRLAVMLSAAGSHMAGWRHPDAQADGGFNFQHQLEYAQAAESAKFDLLFLADGLAIRKAKIDALSRTSSYIVQLEPFTLLAALAAATKRIGLVATASTTYNEPFHIARKFASLDHISNGRAGWNLVTSTNDTEAYNFGQDEHAAHADRYDRAGEFADVVAGLWDTWEDDAFPLDKEKGVYFDPKKLHVLGHKGKHFSVRGPLNVTRPPQGQPVVFQAGSSEPGMELAARTADVVFTAQPTIARAKAFYADLKGRLEKYGRQANELKILPGVSVIVGETAEEAQRKHDRLQELIDPALALAMLSWSMGGDVDLSAYPIDGPVPDDLPESNTGKSRQKLLIDLARRENLTLRQLSLRSSGQWQLVGTPSQIVDRMEEAFVERGADGFVILPPYLPGGLTDFNRHVVPELQRRALFRTEYEGKTLRENLGLKRPAHRPRQKADLQQL